MSLNDLVVYIRTTSIFVYKYNAKHKKVIRLNGMFSKMFSFIFSARTIKPVLTFEYFGSVFSKLKLNYKFLIGLFTDAGYDFPCVSLFLKNNFFRVERVVSSRKY